MGSDEGDGMNAADRSKLREAANAVANGWTVGVNLVATGKGEQLGARPGVTVPPEVLLELLNVAERAQSEADKHAQVYMDSATEAHMVIALVKEALERHPKVCDKYGEDSGVTCGWKAALRDVQWAMDQPQARTTQPHGTDRAPDTDRSES